MPNIQFNHLYRYQDLSRIIKQFAEENPNLVRVESIGTSYEGRDIWLATVTNFASGDASEKPALWIDGNIHASELAPSSACLYFINKLVNEYGKDADITRVLDTRAYYICPRLNPDGAEWALADKPKIIRSSTRPYPYDEEPLDGLAEEDVDGDGRMLQMRIPDPNGPWKISPVEPRLLVRRDPTETGGQYYRIMPEGFVKDFDGAVIRLQDTKEGLDLNRNYPMGWRQEHEQDGAGPYPTSEPEVRAQVHFMSTHPNITGMIAFHTAGGLLLRPYSIKGDDEMPAEDLWTYQKIGQVGTEMTGYPNVSVYHDFRYHPKEIITGASDDWAFDHAGVFAWTIEVWSPIRQAGIKDYKFVDWQREHPFEDDLKLLKWSDEIVSGKAFVDWYPFDHPQLGKVELGGWDRLHAFRNPPPQFLEKELSLFPNWLVWHLLISPRLEVFEANAKHLGDSTYRVRLVVQNTGWLATYVTKIAKKKKLARGVVCEIELPDGATLEAGKAREELGQLEGRAYKASAPYLRTADETDERLKIEWVVRAPKGSKVKLVARHDRAGTVRAEVELGK